MKGAEANHIRGGGESEQGRDPPSAKKNKKRIKNRE